MWVTVPLSASLWGLPGIWTENLASLVLPTQCQWCPRLSPPPMPAQIATRRTSSPMPCQPHTSLSLQLHFLKQVSTGKRLRPAEPVCDTQGCGSPGWPRVGSGTVRSATNRASRARLGAEGTRESCRPWGRPGELAGRSGSGKAATSPPSSDGPVGRQSPQGPTAPSAARTLPTPHRRPPDWLTANVWVTWGCFSTRTRLTLSLSQDTSMHKGTVRFDAGTFCCQSGETGC